MDINFLENLSQRAAYVKTDRSTAQAEKTANPYTAARNQDEFTVSPAARAAMAEKTARSDSAGAVAEGPDASGATAFTSFAVEFDKVTQKYTGIAKAYYAAAHEENLTCGNPAEHIWNKYKNPDSPDFRASMTEDGRSWAYDHEISL
ncbi:MAG: DUF4885 domain-containing protein, partial [Oscillospiraceae bacterium]|nr:DUF4885 domain-containing protein [Oscillospiraceae bacterium]